MTVFKEHLAHDECSSGKVSSTPTAITFAISSRDTQTHPKTTHNEKHTWETQHKWKIDWEWLQARTTQGTLRDTVTHFTACAMSLNTLELSDLVDCSCKETFYHHNIQQSLMGSEHFAKAMGTHWSSDRSSHSRGRPHRQAQGFKDSGVGISPPFSLHQPLKSRFLNISFIRSWYWMIPTVQERPKEPSRCHLAHTESPRAWLRAHLLYFKHSSGCPRGRGAVS